MIEMLISCFVVQVKTVKVSNVSIGASEHDIKEFFSFSGDIAYIELRRLVSEILFVHYSP